MKTLVLFERRLDRFTELNGTIFLELKGDYRHLAGVNIIDAGSLSDELFELIYEESCKPVPLKRLKIKPLERPTKDWDFFIRCYWVEG